MKASKAMEAKSTALGVEEEEGIGPRGGAVEGDDDDDRKYEVPEEGDLPFACFICREGFTEPVVTLCGHYFCRPCAVKRFKEGSSRCAACDKQTFGVFNQARKLIRHLDKIKKLSNNGEGDVEAGAGVAAGTLSRRMAPAGRWEEVAD